jgi:very-short-patch-repair endonuclease
MTTPERIVWSKIRNGQLGGLKFRRQRPLGPNILDFFCADANLCTEIDGEQHAHQREHDHRRDDYLREHGVETLRFTVTDVTKHLDGVLTRIRDVCAQRIEARKEEKVR